MKYKYVILKNNEANELTIKEFAELDKGMLSLLCETTYNEDVIKLAIAEGKYYLIDTLRNRNMFPPVLYAEKIAKSVIDIYDSEDEQSIELMLDDIDFLAKIQDELEEEEEIEDKVTDIDELLETDFDDNYKEKNSIEKNSSIKIVEDDLDTAD